MTRKQIRVSRRMLFTWFMLAGSIFLFAPQNITNKFQFAFARIFRWPLSISRSISLSTHAYQPMTDVVPRREYNQLQNHLANVIEQLNLVHEDVEKLTGMRARLPLQGASLVPADVIRVSIAGSRSELIINRGQSDGLAEGQFVLGDNSIVGTICDVDYREARVRLFTDPAYRIEVKIAGLNIDRVMQGSGSNSAKIPMVSRKHKVRVGDKVFARKKPGLLDAPIIIATVAQCKKDDEKPLLWDITVEPACDFQILEDVAVIIMNP
jgi:cell shape-determining protein MreC